MSETENKHSLDLKKEGKCLNLNQEKYRLILDSDVTCIKHTSVYTHLIIFWLTGWLSLAPPLMMRPWRRSTIQVLSLTVSIVPNINDSITKSFFIYIFFFCWKILSLLKNYHLQTFEDWISVLIDLIYFQIQNQSQICLSLYCWYVTHSILRPYYSIIYLFL